MKYILVVVVIMLVSGCSLFETFNPLLLIHETGRTWRDIDTYRKVDDGIIIILHDFDSMC